MTATNHMDTSVQHVDIAIVGGAMAGATLALALARLSLSAARPLSIALIEAHLPDKQHRIRCSLHRYRPRLNFRIVPFRSMAKARPFGHGD